MNCLRLKDLLIRKLKHNKLVRFVTIVLMVSFFYFHNTRSEITSLEKSNDVITGNTRSTTLLVLIMTGPNNKDRRDVMRHTWLSSELNDFKHYFVIGSKNQPWDVQKRLKEEQQMNNDLLLLEDFEDSYNKLTEKLALMLEWAYYNYEFKYLFKADDDTYALLNVIINELKNNFGKKNTNKLYWGYFYGRSHVKKSGPWKEMNWKLCDYYLPYARGGGYILSHDLVAFVAMNWRMFQFYGSEDVSLGAWLAPLQLTRHHDIRFDTEFKSRGCSNNFIVCHKQGISDMIAKSKNFIATGKICEKEYSYFHGYEYNWNVPPSQCCERTNDIP